MAKEKSVQKLGATVTYTVPDGHLTKTVRGEDETIGSVYHPEMTSFAAIVGRAHEDGSADLVLFPPNRDPKWVAGVEEGDGPGQFQVVAA